MATERGIVVKVGVKKPEMALVRTIQPSTCEACSARHQCNPDVKGKEREVEALNLANAGVGDLIQISVDTGALIKTTFLLYVFPIICMLIGAFLGDAIGRRTGAGASVVSVGSGIACFVAAMAIVRIRAGRMALKQKYQPKITRILSRGKPDGQAPDLSDPCGLEATNGI